MRKTFAVPAVSAALAIFALTGAGCADAPAVHTYWLKNSATGTYSEHRSWVELSPDEIRELGLETELPADAKTDD